MAQIAITPYQSQFAAWQLSRRVAADSSDLLGSTLVDAQVDLNPNQVEAALFAFQSPLSKGAILADEVGLGKAIEAGLVLAPRRAERKRGHLYRIGHPLAQALIERAKARELPAGRLRLDYLAYGTRLSTLEPLRGSTGWLSLSVLTVNAMGTAEDHLLLAAADANGQPLPAEDANKLLRLPAVSQTQDLLSVQPVQLDDTLAQLRRRIVDRQDEIDVERNRLIETLEERLAARCTRQTVFTIEWQLH